MSKKYKVIEIIDEKNIIIDYGKNNGAKIDDEIRIIKDGEPVIDHEQNIKLGNLYLIKETLNVKTVYENFSICNKTISSFQPIFSSASDLGKTIYSKKNLNVDESEITNRVISTNEKIKVGDIVIVK